MERAVCKGVDQERGVQLPEELMEGPWGGWGVGGEDEMLIWWRPSPGFTRCFPWSVAHPEGLYKGTCANIPITI